MEYCEYVGKGVGALLLAYGAVDAAYKLVFALAYKDQLYTVFSNISGGSMQLGFQILLMATGLFLLSVRHNCCKK